jgi:hypothetical protein
MSGTTKCDQIHSHHWYEFGHTEAAAHSAFKSIRLLFFSKFELVIEEMPLQTDITFK